MELNVWSSLQLAKALEQQGVNLPAYNMILLLEQLSLYGVTFAKPPERVTGNPIDLVKVMDFLARGNKISAIKEVRKATQCSLGDAKRSVEDLIFKYPRLWRTEQKANDEALAALREKLTGSPDPQH